MLARRLSQEKEPETPKRLKKPGGRLARSPPKEKEKKKVSSQRPPQRSLSLEAADPWDWLLDKSRCDMLREENRNNLTLLEEKVAAVHYGNDCKSFSRARDKPVKGAKWYPCRLRSTTFPAGLPNLRGGAKDKVKDGNLMARDTAARCRARHACSQGFSIENPARSYLWLLPEFMTLEKTPGSAASDSTTACWEETNASGPRS